MSTQNPIDYAAVLADLEARRDQLELAIVTIKAIIAQGGGAPNTPTGGKVPHDAFLKMSIPDATKKYLSFTRQKKDTQAIIDALEEGGLPRSEYSTVYAVLRRREKQIGDIINLKGDWALAEWYPNYKKSKSTSDEDQQDASDESKATANSA
jgi:hypothetical protein